MKSDLNSLKVAATILRWTARILSLAVIGLLLAFMIAEGFRFWRFTPKELALSLFFPFAVIIGTLLGWRWELLGGLVAVGAGRGSTGCTSSRSARSRGALRSCSSPCRVFFSSWPAWCSDSAEQAQVLR